MKTITNKPSAATTFRKEGVQLLSALFSKLLAGGDPSVLVRTEVFTSVYRKVRKMKERVS